MPHHVKKDYESNELVVLWDSAMCVHSGNCVRGLRTVFNLQAHPWIDMTGASADEIEPARKDAAA